MRMVQEGQPEVGKFFAAMHALADWLAKELFADELPAVCVRMEKLRHQRMAEYRPVDGNWLPYAIVIDPFKAHNGREAAEWMAHEMAHHWQFVTGQMRLEDLQENNHDEAFQNIMMELGLSVESRTGSHRGYVGDVWMEWVKKFEADTSIHLGYLELPGPQEPTRKLHKWQCEECGFSFRTRREGLVVCCEGTEDELHGQTEMGMVE